MSKENVLVELTAPASGKAGGFEAGSGVGAKRLVQVTLNDATVVIDGTTYTRTSPLRTTEQHGGLSIPYDYVAAGDDSYPPVPSSPAVGNVAVAIFSASGT